MQTTGNVYTAIASVMAELAKTGIPKDGRNSQQSYAFRGIDQVYGALAPLLAAHKLCIIPRMLERETVERTTQKGGVLFYTTVKAAFDFVSAVDGTKHEIITYGEAMDSGDKATNKAMSAAYKYAAFMTFCIPVEGESPDADATTHEIAGRPPAKLPAKAAQKPAGVAGSGDPAKGWTTALMARMEAVTDEDGMHAIAVDSAVVKGRAKLAKTRPELEALLKDADRAMFERVGKAAAGEDDGWPIDTHGQDRGVP